MSLFLLSSPLSQLKQRKINYYKHLKLNLVHKLKLLLFTVIRICFVSFSSCLEYCIEILILICCLDHGYFWNLSLDVIVDTNSLYSPIQPPFQISNFVSFTAFSSFGPLAIILWVSVHCSDVVYLAPNLFLIKDQILDQIDLLSNYLYFCVYCKCFIQYN